MTMTQVAEKVDHAIENGRGWMSNIEEMIEKLDQAREADDQEAIEAADREIQESPLSVLVRDGWRQPGSQAEDGAEEYEILLSTGGPALRIWGKLDEYDNPVTAELQHQDWFKPWERCPFNSEAVLRFAECFYFGG